MFLFLTLLLGSLLCAVLLRVHSRKHICAALENIPQPFAKGLLDALPILFGQNPQNVLQVSDSLFGKYGTISYVNAFIRQLVVSIDPEFNEQILSSSIPIMKHHTYKVLQSWLGNGLLLSDGSKWVARRKVITPAFHFKILEGFLEIFEQQSTILIEQLAGRADGCTALDIYPYVSLAALDVIAETAMGTKVYAQTKPGNAYTKAVKELTELVGVRFLQLHVQNEWIFSILYPHRKLRQRKLLKTIHSFTTNVIEERRNFLENMLATNSTTETSQSMGGKRHMALLDVLLQAELDGKPLSNEDIREEVDTFMFEGHDTSTSALCFALHLIARHSHVQHKLYAEIQQILAGIEKHSLTISLLGELKYLECVLKETLRLYPSVPMLGRHIHEDFKYTHSRIGAGVLPAGTEVVISLYSVMRNPKIFEHPHDFIPERFEDNSKNSGFCYLPFSAGPRNCIGQKFAMLELKVMLVKILCAYELLPLGPAVRTEVNIVLRSANGFQLGLKQRSL